MYVRLAFAVAAHLEPEILIVDEVLAVGDVQFRRKCLGKMSEVAKTGRTVIFVSHNMGAIHKLCTRAMLIKDGMIADDGKVEEIISKYINPNLAELQSSMILPGAEGNSPGRGLRLTFTDLNNVEKNQFNMGDHWKIQFEFEIFRKTPHVSAAIGPRNFDVSIKTFRTKPVDLEAGVYRAEFEFNIPLKSTELQFAVGLTTYETTFYYYHDAGHASISEIYKGKHLVKTKGAGLLIDDEFEEIIRIR
jgi:ABC-type Fe3+/spermidine/putrescine transport system ATPase subunit